MQALAVRDGFAALLPAKAWKNAGARPKPCYGGEACAFEGVLTTSAAGHSSRQDNPSGAKSRPTSASRLSAAMREITVEPNPCLEGA